MKPIPSDLLGLTEEQFRRFDRACHATLNAIAADLPGTHTRSAIVEVVLDASYLEMYGADDRRTPDPEKPAPMPWKVFYRSVVEPWIAKNYHERKFKKLMTFVFPFGRYSL